MLAYGAGFNDEQGQEPRGRVLQRPPIIPRRGGVKSVVGAEAGLRS